MGIVINGEITLKSGVKVTNAYLSLSGERIRLIGATPRVKNEYPGVRYTFQGSYTLWISQDAAKETSPEEALDRGSLDFTVTDDDLNKPIHQIAYDYIKTNIYTNFTNHI